MNTSSVPVVCGLYTNPQTNIRHIHYGLPGPHCYCVKHSLECVPDLCIYLSTGFCVCLSVSVFTQVHTECTGVEPGHSVCTGEDLSMLMATHFQ